MLEDNSNQKNIEDRLIELEAKLLEQEHRPFKLIWNFWNRKKYSNQNDKRRKAVSKALLFRFFFSPTTLAIAGTGIISFFTIYFMFRQTQLFEKQNKLFEFQNTRIEEQNQLSEASRRSSQIFIMGEVLSDINKEVENPRNKKRILSNSLVGRIITLSRAMKPYRYLKNNELTNIDLSPERGQLLIALLESNINKEFICERIFSKSDFTYSDLANANFSDVNLNNINLENSNLKNINVNKATINNSNLKNSNLKNSRFNFVEINDTRLDSSKLLNAKFDNSKLYKVSFYGAKFDSKTKINLSKSYGFGIDFLLTSFNNFHQDITISETIIATKPEIIKIKKVKIYDRMEEFKYLNPRYDYEIHESISGDEYYGEGYFYIRVFEISKPKNKYYPFTYQN